ncbi:RAS small monomeric GTPase [Fusarium subglutinans]|uniref:RAS small monomeric GTPase n=1 Tax=Gibberella subglutinans TaxID=42677 RepID=A0A8H5P0Z3_GIBSU|nr:RAS small monomeric GTPase [Fusarium subglutinans]KAF5584108.1 RAS small monomeric GTPase [Fusarium subglutinans]
MAVPKCYRCRVRSIECLYPHPSTRRTLARSSKALSQETAGITVDESQTDSQNTSITSDITFDADDLALPPFPDYDLDWQEAMTNLNDFLVPDLLNPHDTAEKSVLAGEKYQRRIVYTIERFKSYPKQLVLHGQIPFIHRRIVEKYLPPPLTRTLAICALYEIKCETNQQLVYSTIQQHADELIDLIQLADSDVDLLSSVQAFILLQIIRLLDGDIRQRANAENVETFFVNSIRRLQQRMISVEESTQILSSQLRTPGSDAWEIWCLTESLRRTVIIGYSLHGLYSFLRNGWDDAHHEFPALSFFGQRALWSSTSRFEWESAVAKCHTLPIRFAHWESDMATAKPEDIDELGIIMMALTTGIDDCCRWVGNDLLENFGLKP